MRSPRQIISSCHPYVITEYFVAIKVLVAVVVLVKA